MTNTEIVVALERWSHDPALRDRARRALSRAARRLLEEESALGERAAASTLTELRLVGPFTAGVIRDLVAGVRPPEPPAAEWPAEIQAQYEATEPSRRHYLAVRDARQLVRAHHGRAPRGDLQVHTTWSDGAGSPAEMAEEARRLGYEFLAITDHAGGLRIARGMTPETMRLHRAEVALLNRESPLRLFAGIEANLTPAGTLDVDTEMMRGTEIVLVGSHSHLRAQEDQTARMVAAVSHPHVHVLAHGRGRLFGVPRGIRAHWDEVFDAAAGHGTAIEIDAYPDRQDLDHTLVADAARRGCIISLGTDAHAAGHLAWMDVGVAHLILAGVPPEQVVNYWALPDVEAWLARKRAD